MKPKEYVEKYGLDKKDGKFRFKEFVSDLTVDFITMVEYHLESNPNLTKFRNCVSQVRQKYDSIVTRAKVHIDERPWKYLYASVIAPMREEIFGEAIRKKKEERERRNREWDELFSSWYVGLFTSFPRRDFEILQLSRDADEREVIKKFRMLAMDRHPDRGGKEKDFIELMEAKNRCLSYIKAKGD